MSPAELAEIAARLRAVYGSPAIATFLGGPDTPVNLTRYRNDPNGFVRDVLGVTLTPDQEIIAAAMARGGRVKVSSGHNVGKTYLAACLVLWWFHTRPAAVVITTAPTERDVIDLLWNTVRHLHYGARIRLPNHFVGPRAPELFESEEHWARGYTARQSESFQGRHHGSMMFVFDEDEGIAPLFWTTTSTMYKHGSDHVWLAIGNPTTTSSQSYLEELAAGAGGSPKWKHYSLSALNHPNVLAELAGCAPPVPDAVSLGQVEQYVQDWTDPVFPGDKKATDLEWPPGSGLYRRPGPSFLSRVMGRRPTSGVDTVWSADAWDRAVNPAIPTPERLRAAWGGRAGVTIGCDPALFGDDDTSLHVRIGPVSVHHESHNGWPPDRTAGRLKELAAEFSEYYNRLAFLERPGIAAPDVAVIIEGDGGFGGGVWSHRGDFRRWVLVSAGASGDAFHNGRPVYANARSQWWCESANAASSGGVDLSPLPGDVRAKLRLQLLAPCYWPLPNGARAVEPKKDLKGRLKRSPDDADAFILSRREIRGRSLPSAVIVEKD
jgi:hypothetical protein